MTDQEGRFKLANGSGSGGRGGGGVCVGWGGVDCCFGSGSKISFISSLLRGSQAISSEKSQKTETFGSDFSSSTEIFGQVRFFRTRVQHWLLSWRHLKQVFLLDQLPSTPGPYHGSQYESLKINSQNKSALFL